MYRLTCPSCRHALETPFVRQGASTRCPSCRQAYAIKPVHVQKVIDASVASDTRGLAEMTQQAAVRHPDDLTPPPRPAAAPAPAEGSSVTALAEAVAEGVDPAAAAATASAAGPPAQPAPPAPAHTRQPDAEPASARASEHEPQATPAAEHATPKAHSASGPTDAATERRRTRRDGTPVAAQTTSHPERSAARPAPQAPAAKSPELSGKDLVQALAEQRRKRDGLQLALMGSGVLAVVVVGLILSMVFKGSPKPPAPTGPVVEIGSDPVAGQPTTVKPAPKPAAHPAPPAPKPSTADAAKVLVPRQLPRAQWKSVRERFVPAKADSSPISLAESRWLKPVDSDRSLELQVHNESRELTPEATLQLKLVDIQHQVYAVTQVPVPLLQAGEKRNVLVLIPEQMAGEMMLVSPQVSPAEDSAGEPWHSVQVNSEEGTLSGERVLWLEVNNKREKALQKLRVMVHIKGNRTLDWLADYDQAIPPKATARLALKLPANLLSEVSRVTAAGR